METSMTITSGPRSTACRHAASPSAASPTTSMSGWASIRARSPARTTLWSSARRMRNLVAMIGISRGLPQGDAGTHRGPAAVLRFDQEPPAYQRHALPHPEQAQAPATRTRPGPLRVEPPAVVLDQGGDLTPVALHDHTRTAGPGVLRHVVQGLLHETVDCRLDLGRQSVAVQAGGLEGGEDPGPLGPAGDICGQGRAQAEVVQGGRPQLDGQVVRLAADPADDRLDLAQPG